jgi:hypothetical protein
VKTGQVHVWLGTRPARPGQLAASVREMVGGI